MMCVHGHTEYTNALPGHCGIVVDFVVWLKGDLDNGIRATTATTRTRRFLLSLSNDQCCTRNADTSELQKTPQSRYAVMTVSNYSEI